MSEGVDPAPSPSLIARSISHDRQTLENLIELSTRNIAVVVVEAIHTFPGFQRDMPVDYIGSRGEERRVERKEEKFGGGRTPSNITSLTTPSSSARENLICFLPPQNLIAHGKHDDGSTATEGRATDGRTKKAKTLQSFSLGAINPAWISPHSDSGGGRRRHRRTDGSVCTSGGPGQGGAPRFLRVIPNPDVSHATSRQTLCTSPFPNVDQRATEWNGVVTATGTGF